MPEGKQEASVGLSLFDGLQLSATASKQLGAGSGTLATAKAVRVPAKLDPLPGE